MTISTLINQVKELRADTGEDHNYRNGFNDARQQVLTMLRQIKKEATNEDD